MELDRIYNKSSQRMDELPDESIDIAMTSPPYWGLRDYGEDVKEIWGGDPDCEHNFNEYIRPNGGGHSNSEKAQVGASKKDIQRVFGAKAAFCQKCGAWHGQLGLEPTFQLYLDHMMIVCAEIKRVLKKTGSFWLNMGDTYAGGGGGNYGTGLSVVQKDKGLAHLTNVRNRENWLRENRLQPKCLIGIPSRLRNRLIDEQDWTCRNTVIWVKPNPMPSSKKDALTPSYEFLFHFVKNTKPQYCWNEKMGLMADRKPSKAEQIEDIDWEWRECSRCLGKGNIEETICPRCKGTSKIKHSFWHSLGYWYDLDAIREPHKESSKERYRYSLEGSYTPGNVYPDEKREKPQNWNLNSAGRNPGDVWTIPTQPRPEAHFATFPDKLCIKPILATCPQEICKKCGKARVRITKSKFTAHTGITQSEYQKGTSANRLALLRQAAREAGSEYLNERETIGWTDCGCNAGWDSGVLLDPFGGRGTSAVMAKKMGRHYIVYELKKEYCEKLIKPALEEIDPLFNWKTPSLQAREKK